MNLNPMQIFDLDKTFFVFARNFFPVKNESECRIFHNYFVYLLVSQTENGITKVWFIPKTELNRVKLR